MEYPYNSNIGYRFTDFTYPIDKEFIIRAGETVVTLLDKIKNILGTYEYFFDIDGNFIFQQIKDYANEGSSVDNLVEAINDKYLINAS
jgi:prophage tail gpP-like protein